MKKSSFSVVVVIAIMWASHMLVDFMIGVWAVYKTIAGLDIALAGLIAGVSALVGEGMQAYFGLMSDRGYRHKLVVLGLGLSTVSVLMAYSDHYFFLFLFVLFTCIGSGAFHPAAVSVVNELSEKRKALFMTIFQSGGALGLAFSQLIFSQVYFLFEGHTFFLVIPTLLLIVLIVLKAYGSQEEVSQSTPSKSIWSNLSVFFRSRELTCLYITQLCNQSVFWGAVFLLPDILISRGYDSWVSLGGAHLCLILGGAIMMVPIGYLADRFSCKSIIIWMSALGSITLYVFLLNPYLAPLALCCLLFIIGASLGSISPVVVALGNRLSPTNPGIVSAFLMGLVWCMAEGIGQGGGGLMTKFFDENAPTYALACLGILFFISFATSLGLPKEEKSLQLEFS